MLPLDGSFNSVTETAAAAVGPVSGKHLIYVRGRDALGNWGPVRGVFIDAVTCTTTFATTSAAFDARGGVGVINITTPANCPWSLASNDDWLILRSPVAGSGSGPVNFEVRENFADQPRSGQITIGGQAFIVNQAGRLQDGCAISFTPGNTVVSGSGGDATVSITTTADCLWTAASKVSWITISSSSSGIGPGSFSFHVTANPASTARKGVITIAGQKFAVKQRGS
jgi:Putative binding domain, N-terminal/Viral BACON domain